MLKLVVLEYESDSLNYFFLSILQMNRKLLRFKAKLNLALVKCIKRETFNDSNSKNWQKFFKFHIYEISKP